MSESIIFNSPLLLTLYGVALALNLFELKNKATGYILPLASVAVVMGVSLYAFLLGASLFEVTIIFLIFLLINLTGMGGKEK